MLDSLSQTPLIEFKGENLHLIHINLDNSESSTKESNISGENSKCFDDTIEEQKLNYKPQKEKLLKAKAKERFLNRKTKRDKILDNSSKKTNNKIINGKYKIIFNLFNEFKSCSKLYKEYTQFHFIEKNIKNDLYNCVGQLASEIRNIFSRIFATTNDPKYYNKTLNFCELFEKIYKKYENKKLTKKCKNLSEIINKLKRELRQAEFYRNTPIENKHYINKKNHNFFGYSSPKNKFQIDFNNNYNEDTAEKSVKKNKNIISNKINKLNNEQKRGILGIISNNYIDKNSQNTVMEINVNKMPFLQLKELEKYLDKCIKENNSNISFPKEKKSQWLNFEDEKECDILKNDDLSSCLSDDDEDDEE